jgi:hypothetical protein
MNKHAAVQAGISHLPQHEVGRVDRRLESFNFFRAWLVNPPRVASIVPSSTQLALAVTKETSTATGPVLALGPGTGVFTRALLARGVAEADIALVESGSEFRAGLRQQFPRATLLEMDAAHLHTAEFSEPFNAGAVVSGLPLLSMSPAQSPPSCWARFIGSFYADEPLGDGLGRKTTVVDNDFVATHTGRREARH